MGRGGGSPLPLSPLAVRRVFRSEARPRFCHLPGRFVALHRVTVIVSRLEVAPVFRDFFRGSVTELFPTADRDYLVYDERERMFRVARLVIVNRTEASLTYTARGVHSLKTRPVLSPSVSVRRPRVVSHPPRLSFIV